jgi:ubiquitin-activating enzyme E1
VSLSLFIGHEAQNRLSQAKLLILGLAGLGVEVAKNIILAGVQSVDIYDETIVKIEDLAAQFYLSPAAVGFYQ